MSYTKRRKGLLIVFSAALALVSEKFRDRPRESEPGKISDVFLRKENLLSLNVCCRILEQTQKNFLRDSFVVLWKEFGGHSLP